MSGILRLLRWIFGYVSFGATGGFAERFLNLCNRRQIELWNVKNDGVKVTGFTHLKDYERLSEPAENAGMVLTDVKKHGAIITIKQHKTRLGLCFGAIFAALLIFVASGCVWNLEISGNNAVKVEDFADELRPLGVYIGARKSRIDTDAVEKALLKENCNLSWVSLNLYGSKALLEVREISEKPEVDDGKIPSNLVAKKNGIITLTECFRGECKVKENDVVMKGDLLIAGITRNDEGAEILIGALGNIRAKTETLLSAGKEKNASGYAVKGYYEKYRLLFFGLEFPVISVKNGGVFSGESEKMMTGGSETLPIGIKEETYFEEEQVTAELSKTEATLWALLECVKKSRAEFSENDLESITYTIEEKNGRVTVTAKGIGVENIAVKGKLS